MEHRADLILLQEVRAAAHQFPPELTRLEYHTHWHFALHPGYSGAGLLILEKPRRVTLGMGSAFDAEGRLVRADFEDFTAVSTGPRAVPVPRGKPLRCVS